MTEPVTLGLDLGTSGVRGVALAPDGSLLAEATRSYPLLTPRPGWTEQRPADWGAASLEVLRELAEQLPGRAILALGLSGQMHGMVPLGEDGAPLHHALLWNDQRTGGAVAEMLERVPRRTFIERTGNPPITGFHLSKLLWLRREEPGLFAKARHSLLPKDYLGYLLTGDMVSEPSDDSGTNGFHLATKVWDEEILGALELPLSLFPGVVASDGLRGHLKADIARQTALPAGLPVVAGAGDNAAAATAMGLSSRTPGVGSLSLGTSGVIFAPLQHPTPDPEGRVHLFCHADGDYHLLGVTLSAAGSLRWLRDTLFPDLSFADLDELAAASEPGANGVIFKPYLAGERSPHLDPDLRGSFSGLSLATRRGDLVRSVLEGVAFSLRDTLDVIQPLAPLQRLRVTGGGAKSPLWLQIMADVLELPLELPAQTPGAAHGAALLAHSALGSRRDSGIEAPRQRFEPQQPEPYRAALAAYRELPPRGATNSRG